MDRLPIGRKPAVSELGSWCRRAGNRKTWLRPWASLGARSASGSAKPAREVFQPCVAASILAGSPS